MVNKRVTISLLSWNGAHYLPWLLKSLQAQTFNDWELLVLDNGSSDNSVAVIREYYPPAKIVQQKQNIGFARANNLLVNWSKSDYVLFLNHDVVLSSDYLAKTVEFLDTHPLAGSVSGKLLYWDFHSSVKTKTIDSLGLKIDRKRQVIDEDQGQSDKPVPTQEKFGLSATALLARRGALEKIKFDKGNGNGEYFDEDFFSYKEDIDLAWRLRLNGWENWLLADTIVYHHRTVNKTAHKLRKERGLVNKMSYRNHLAMLYKNSFVSHFWHDVFYILWYEIRKFFYVLFFEQTTLKGLKEFIGLLPKLKKKRKQIKASRKVNPEEIYRWFK